jgi:hypothetical protein
MRKQWGEETMSRRTRALAVGLMLALGGTGAVAAGPVQGACTDASKACLAAAAKSYLDGLVTRDGSKVQFGPSITIHEHGRTTPLTEAEARHYVDGQVPMKGYRNLRHIADAESHTVVQLAEIDLTFGEADATRMKTTPADHTIYVANTFKVEAGLIREIDTRFHLGAASPAFAKP